MRRRRGGCGASLPPAARLVDDDPAVRLVDDDPAVRHGVMQAELLPFRVALWSAQVPAGSDE